jgi:hypothetical protein
MKEKLNKGDGSQDARRSRRALLAASLFAGTALPARWMKPVIESVTLPAHARSSVVATVGLRGTTTRTFPIGTSPT